MRKEKRRSMGRSKKILGLFMMWMILCIPTNIKAEGGTALSIKAADSKQLLIRWEVQEDAGGYHLYRADSTQGKYRLLTKASATQNQYKDSKLEPGRKYYYRLVPLTTDGKEENNERALTISGRTVAGVSVTNLSIRSSNTIKLTWKQVKYASGYQVYRSKKKNSEYQLIKEIKNGATVSFTDTSLTPGVDYYYKIRAVVLNQKTAGCGSFSAHVNARTVQKTKVTSMKTINVKKIQLNWKRATGASGYKVYRADGSGQKYKLVKTVSAGTLKYVDSNIHTGKTYYYKIKAVSKLNGTIISGGYSDEVAYRALNKVKVSSVKFTSSNTMKVSWSRVSGATEYRIYRATTKNGNYTKIATVKDNKAKTQSYTDKNIYSGKSYYYKVQAYSKERGVILAGAGEKSEIVKATAAYSIMGKTEVTVEQMVRLFKSSGRSFPKSVYKSKGADSIEKFCRIVLSESEAEGVKAEVIFAQVCLETGYLSFGGQVKASQCNFAGLGATDDGASGATFPNVRTGLRAQVQHLKGYASTEDLKQKCVDPRFHYLAGRRGTAKYVQSLGNGNWATDPLYASKLMRLIQQMKSY